MFDKSAVSANSQQPAGSTFYVSPEGYLPYLRAHERPVFERMYGSSQQWNLTYDCYRSDVWSFGATTFTMATGRPLFTVPSVRDARFRSFVRCEQTRELQDQRLFELAPSSGLWDLTEEEVPWQWPEHFSPLFVDFLRQCLQILPNKRATAAQLMHHGWFVQHASWACTRMSALVANAGLVALLQHEATEATSAYLRDGKLVSAAERARAPDSVRSNSRAPAGPHRQTDDAQFMLRLKVAMPFAWPRLAATLARMAPDSRLCRSSWCLRLNPTVTQLMRMGLEATPIMVQSMPDLHDALGTPTVSTNTGSPRYQRCSTAVRGEATSPCTRQDVPQPQPLRAGELTPVGLPHIKVSSVGRSTPVAPGRARSSLDVLTQTPESGRPPSLAAPLLAGEVNLDAQGKPLSGRGVSNRSRARSAASQDMSVPGHRPRVLSECLDTQQRVLSQLRGRTVAFTPLCLAAPMISFPADAGGRKVSIPVQPGTRMVYVPHPHQPCLHLALQAYSTHADARPTQHLYIAAVSTAVLPSLGVKRELTGSMADTLGCLDTPGWSLPLLNQVHDVLAHTWLEYDSALGQMPASVVEGAGRVSTTLSNLVSPAANTADPTSLPTTARAPSRESPDGPVQAAAGRAPAVKREPAITPTAEALASMGMRARKGGAVAGSSPPDAQTGDMSIEEAVVAAVVAPSTGLSTGPKLTPILESRATATPRTSPGSGQSRVSAGQAAAVAQHLGAMAAVQSALGSSQSGGLLRPAQRPNTGPIRLPALATQPNPSLVAALPRRRPRVPPVSALRQGSFSAGQAPPDRGSGLSSGSAGVTPFMPQAAATSVSAGPRFPLGSLLAQSVQSSPSLSSAGVKRRARGGSANPSSSSVSVTQPESQTSSGHAMPTLQSISVAPDAPLVRNPSFAGVSDSGSVAGSDSSTKRPRISQSLGSQLRPCDAPSSGAAAGSSNPIAVRPWHAVQPHEYYPNGGYRDSSESSAVVQASIAIAQPIAGSIVRCHSFTSVASTDAMFGSSGPAGGLSGHTTNYSPCPSTVPHASRSISQQISLGEDLGGRARSDVPGARSGMPRYASLERGCSCNSPETGASHCLDRVDTAGTGISIHDSMCSQAYVGGIPAGTSAPDQPAQQLFSRAASAPSWRNSAPTLTRGLPAARGSPHLHQAMSAGRGGSHVLAEMLLSSAGGAGSPMATPALPAQPSPAAFCISAASAPYHFATAVSASSAAEQSYQSQAPPMSGLSVLHMMNSRSDASCDHE